LHRKRFGVLLMSAAMGEQEKNPAKWDGTAFTVCAPKGKPTETKIQKRDAMARLSQRVSHELVAADS